MKTFLRYLLLCVPLAGVALPLGGCVVMDPYQRFGVWRPIGANELNRELQVARPTDLVQGRGTLEADGDTAAKAVDRMRRDAVKPLAETGISKVGAAGNAAAAPAAGPGT